MHHRRVASLRLAWMRVIPLAYLAVTELGPALHGHPNPGWKPHLVGALSGIALGGFLRALKSRLPLMETWLAGRWRSGRR